LKSARTLSSTVLQAQLYDQLVFFLYRYLAQ
jgi:hypothetical protein